jgi:Glycosyltransferase family 17
MPTRVSTLAVPRITATNPIAVILACAIIIAVRILFNGQSGASFRQNHIESSVNGTGLVNDQQTETMRRDGSLSDLVRLMNSPDMANVFNAWDSNPDMDRFLELLSPWIIKGEAPIKVHSRPAIKLNCSQARYSPVLTGRPLADTKAKPHFLVDFVMFGYDVEKLLLKFYETYDDVDVFVVYESPYTLMGTRKPLYFEQLKREPRFARFLDKVVHIISREEDIRPSVNATRAAFARGERGCSGEVSHCVMMSRSWGESCC